MARRSFTTTAILGTALAATAACGSPSSAGTKPVDRIADLLSPGSTLKFPLADAALRGGAYADTAFGGNEELKAKQADGSYARVSAIEFDLSNVASDSQVMRFWVYGGTDGADVKVRAVVHGDEGTWDESSATWTGLWLSNADFVNAAAADPATPAQTFTQAAGWHSYDLQVALGPVIDAGYTTATVFLVADSQAAVVTMASREVGNVSNDVLGGRGMPYLITSGTGTGQSGGSCNFDSVLPAPKNLNICRELVEDLVVPPVLTSSCDVGAICILLPHCCLEPLACITHPECGTAKAVTKVAGYVAHSGDVYCGAQDITSANLVDDLVNDRVPDPTTLVTGGTSSVLYSLAGGYIDAVECNAIPLSGDVRGIVRGIMQLPGFDGFFTDEDLERARILPHRGSAALNLPKDGYAAITLDSLVIMQDYLYDALNEGDWSLGTHKLAFGGMTANEKEAIETVVHELVHVRQYRELGREQFANNYLREALAHGYAQDAFEVEAYSVSGSGGWLQGILK